MYTSEFSETYLGQNKCSFLKYSKNMYDTNKIYNINDFYGSVIAIIHTTM